MAFGSHNLAELPKAGGRLQYKQGLANPSSIQWPDSVFVRETPRRMRRRCPPTDAGHLHC